MMTDWIYLSDLGELNDLSISWQLSDIPRVRVCDDGNGIEIDAPGSGAALLSNADARALLSWLNRRFILDELARIPVEESNEPS